MPSDPIERAQPWLGTFVRIRVAGLPASKAHAAIDQAFLEIATIHRLMSFHSQDSDLTRLNRFAARQPVEVHPHTYRTLHHVQELSRESNGFFDPTRGQGAWHDIELLDHHTVRFRRPLCLDLGGIAKGYAVDRATEALLASGAPHLVVNAGGDLRVHGQTERILLDRRPPVDQLPVLELSNASAASSQTGPHVDGQTRIPLPPGRFACVVAPTCVLADGLTKVLLANPARAAPILRRFNATGWFLP